jgi:hypothetical protein
MAFTRAPVLGSRRVRRHLLQQWARHDRERALVCYFRDVHDVAAAAADTDARCTAHHAAVTAKMRGQVLRQWLDAHPLVALGPADDPAPERTLLFEDAYTLTAEPEFHALNKLLTEAQQQTDSNTNTNTVSPAPSSSGRRRKPPAHPLLQLLSAPDAMGSARFWRRYQGDHVIVLCHGYQGSAWDLRRWRNAIAQRCPGALLLLSSANEGVTEQSIGAMGQRLADEVHDFILKNCHGGVGRLSFLGHSMGGVIVRAALECAVMHQYHRHLYTLLTLAAPHCGFVQAQTTLVSTGLWFLRKWTGAASLAELSLADTRKPDNCLLRSLALGTAVAGDNVLAHFRHVFLLASQQDSYAPFHSARMQLHDPSSAPASASSKARCMAEMVRALLRHLSRPNPNVFLLARELVAAATEKERCFARERAQAASGRPAPASDPAAGPGPSPVPPPARGPVTARHGDHVCPFAAPRAPAAVGPLRLRPRLRVRPAAPRAPPRRLPAGPPHVAGQSDRPQRAHPLPRPARVHGDAHGQALAGIPVATATHCIP